MADGEEAPSLALSADGLSTSIPPQMVANTFYSMTGPEWVERAMELCGPEPVATLGHSVTYADENFGRVPRAYIECTRDKAVPVGVQRFMRQALPCRSVKTLESDHSPFYSRPQQLAKALLEIEPEL